MHCILKTIIGKITVFDFGESFALCQRFDRTNTLHFIPFYPKSLHFNFGNVSAHCACFCRDIYTLFSIPVYAKSLRLYFGNVSAQFKRY